MVFLRFVGFASQLVRLSFLLRRQYLHNILF
jgi:hypothetical protein